MNEENENVGINDDNQDEFDNLFFNGQPTASDNDESVDEVSEDQEDVEEVVEDSGEEEVETPATDEDEETDESEEEEKPKGKNRKSAQERINELTAARREAERREAALLKRLEELENAVKTEKVDEKPFKDTLAEGAPNPDAKGEDGEPLYELGEFDPKFIRDLTKFTIEQETKAAKEAATREAQERAMQEAKAQLQNEWLTKLEKAEEELPDIRENISDLVDSFQNLDPAYGEYLASTIMASEVGPELMYYLSNNIGEAQKIVASGPAAATLMLGRLEARLIKSPETEKKSNIKRVSEAPPPPENRVRGVDGKYTVKPDTDDQDAFERIFFTKK